VSRYYRMAVTVKGHNALRKDEIIKAASQEWNFEGWQELTGALWATGEENLTSSEEEFVTTISKMVWKANQAFCQVQIDATYLDDLPSETHQLTEEDYRKLVNP